jgi:hypothetical protein
MKKKYTICFFIMFLLYFPTGTPSAENAPQQVCFYDQCYNVEVAQTRVERFRGLQHRESLDEDAGMLFIFEEDKRHSFWMKDTLLPLDIIWMDEKKRIVTIISHIPPCKMELCPVYSPDQIARYVLELNAGETAAAGLKVGNEAVFR